MALLKGKFLKNCNIKARIYLIFPKNSTKTNLKKL